jgi:hypothetical protein
MHFAWRATMPLVVALAGSAAGAQPIDDATRAAARDMGYAGVEAFQAGRYPAASEKFEKAYRIVRTPALGLWSARALAKLGLYVEAAERYQEVTLLEASGSGVAVQKQAQADASAELAALAPKIPRIVISLFGARNADAKVTIDGAPLASELVGEPRPINPGRHQIAAARGDERVSTEVLVAEGERKQVVLHFEKSTASGLPVRPEAPDRERGADPVPPAPADAAATSDPGATRRMMGWVGIGVGGTALVVSGVTDILALKQLGEIHDTCGGDTCPSSQSALVDKYATLRSITIFSLVGGSVVAGAGAALLLTAPKPSAPVTLVMSPGWAGVAGRF